MTDSMTDITLSAVPVHTPLGSEHPYLQSNTERSPRYPLAGQPVTIGIQSASGSIQLEWTLNGIPQAAIPAVQHAETADLWQAIVPAQSDSVIVGYTIVSTAISGETKRVGPFAYEVVAWKIDPQTTINWQETKTGVWTGQFRQSASPDQPGLLKIISIERLNGSSAPTRRIRVTFASPPDEAFYGFGERFNALDQRGQCLDVRCFEQYKDQGSRTYIPMPFFVSSRGYGLFLETSRYVSYDLAASMPDRWSFEAEVGSDGNLLLVLLTSPDLIEISALFSDYVGKPVMPPAWSFGPWMSGNEWNSQARVIEEVEATLAHNIPASVLVIEAWSDETTFYIWNDAQYTPKSGAETFNLSDFTFPADGKWPDPKGLIDWLHAHEIRIILWQVPAFKKLAAPHPQQEADEAYILRENLIVREADGSPYRIRPFWFQGGFVWDVTNPRARDWWLNKRAYLLDDLEIDGFKTDGGEHLWGYDLQFADGRTGAELWNEYPLLYTGAYHDFATAHRAEALTFSRAGFTGAQRYPAHWAGDENSTWDAFRHSILAGLSAGISGISFWGWDIGGFSGEIPTAELYMRATAMAAFCPIMQYHAEFNDHRELRRDRTPWNIQARTENAKVVPTYQFYANVRMNLMPYILAEAAHYVDSGRPMMQSLALAYSTDLCCRDYPYEYLFGRDLLIVPVVDENAQEYEVYLPEGSWYDLWTMRKLAGGQKLRLDIAIERIPVYVRAGAELPLYLSTSGKLGDGIDNHIQTQPNALFEAFGELATIRLLLQ